MINIMGYKLKQIGLALLTAGALASAYPTSKAGHEVADRIHELKLLRLDSIELRVEEVKEIGYALAGITSFGIGFFSFHYSGYLFRKRLGLTE